MQPLEQRRLLPNDELAPTYDRNAGISHTGGTEQKKYTQTLCTSESGAIMASNCWHRQSSRTTRPRARHRYHYERLYPFADPFGTVNHRQDRVERPLYTGCEHRRTKTRAVGASAAYTCDVLRTVRGLSRTTRLRLHNDTDTR